LDGRIEKRNNNDDRFPIFSSAKGLFGWHNNWLWIDVPGVEQ
ncbi:hypothetical protein Tco_0645097, partial [Tanacetum coccineum]